MKPLRNCKKHRIIESTALFNKYLPFCKLIILRRLGITRAPPGTSWRFRCCRDTESCPPLDRPYPPSPNRPITSQYLNIQSQWHLRSPSKVRTDRYQRVLRAISRYYIESRPGLFIDASTKEDNILDRSSFLCQRGPVEYTSRPLYSGLYIYSELFMLWHCNLTALTCPMLRVFLTVSHVLFKPFKG